MRRFCAAAWSDPTLSLSSFQDVGFIATSASLKPVRHAAAAVSEGVERWGRFFPACVGRGSHRYDRVAHKLARVRIRPPAAA